MGRPRTRRIQRKYRRVVTRAWGELFVYSPHRWRRVTLFFYVRYLASRDNGGAA